MRWEKIVVLLVVAYIAISLPLYVANREAAKSCEAACSSQGFDSVISASVLGESSCRCFDSTSRAEKTIGLG